MSDELLGEELSRISSPQAVELGEASQRSLHVELVTNSRCIRGWLRWSRAMNRLLDMLNYGGPTLHLADAQVASLGQEWEEALRWRQAQVRKAEVTFAIPHEESSAQATAGGVRAPSRRPLEYVEKVPHRVWLGLPAFAVRGDAHLAPGGDPASVPFLTLTGFVALTNAEAVYLADPGIVWREAVMLVNIAKAEVYCPPDSAAGLSPKEFL